MNLNDWINFKNPAFRTVFMLYAVVAVLGFALVVANAKLLPLFFLVLSIALFLLNKKMLLLVLYIVYLPTNGLINREDFLLGVFGIQQILGILTFVALAKVKSTNKLTVFQKIAGRLMLVLIVYMVYTFLKNAFFGLMDANWVDAIKKVLNTIVLFGPLLLVLKKCTSDTIKGWTAMGVFFGVLNQAVYCFLSPVLPELGFYSLGTEAFFASSGTADVSRYIGVMGNGDSNTLGAFFVMSVGFFLSRPDSFNKSTLIKIVAALCVLAVALTASRTAFLSLALIGMLFLSKRGSGKIKFQLILGVILIAALSSPLWDTLLSRLSGAGAEQLNTDTSSNRIGKWLLYFDHFVSHPTTFLYGSSEVILIGFKDIFIAAHNFYIQVVYNAGLVFLVLFAKQYMSILKLMIDNFSNFRLIFILIPFMAITFFVSDFGIFVYFSVFLALSATRNSVRKPGILMPQVK